MLEIMTQVREELVDWNEMEWTSIKNSGKGLKPGLPDKKPV
jgi:hypothetical protein